MWLLTRIEESIGLIKVLAETASKVSIDSLQIPSTSGDEQCTTAMLEIWLSIMLFVEEQWTFWSMHISLVSSITFLPFSLEQG